MWVSSQVRSSPSIPPSLSCFSSFFRGWAETSELWVLAPFQPFTLMGSPSHLQGALGGAPLRMVEGWVLGSESQIHCWILVSLLFLDPRATQIWCPPSEELYPCSVFSMELQRGKQTQRPLANQCTEYHTTCQYPLSTFSGCCGVFRVLNSLSSSYVILLQHFPIQEGLTIITSCYPDINPVSQVILVSFQKRTLL